MAARRIVLPLIVGLLALRGHASRTEPTRQGRGVELPPWQRLLRKDDARLAAELERRSLELASQDRPAEAVSAARRLVRLREAAQGPDHWQTINSKENLNTINYLCDSVRERRLYFEGLRLLGEAAGLRATGHPDGAARAYKQHVRIHEQVFGEDHVRTARAYLCAPGLLEQPAEEEEYLRKALRVVRKVLGDDHPDTAGACALLARNLNARGRPGEAEPLDRDALLIRSRILGEEDPLTIQSHVNYAFTLLHQGKSGEAEIAYRRALALSRRALGEDHRTTALAFGNLGGCLYEQGRLIEAHEAFDRALTIQRKTLGDRHIETIGSFLNVAGILDDLGQGGRSEELYRETIGILGTAPNVPRVRTAQALSGLATTLEGQGRSLEAEQVLRNSLEIFGATIGNDHPETASCSLNLALLLSGAGKTREAEAECRRALAILQDALGRRHPQTAACIHVLARIQMDQGRLEEAEMTLNRAAGLYSRNRASLVRPGLEGAAWSRRNSPLEMLSVILARNGKPGQAWERLEQSRGRATLDEIVARTVMPPEVQEQLGRLRIELKQIDEAIQGMDRVRPPARVQPLRRALLDRREGVQEALDRSTDHLVRAHGFPEGGSYSLERVQAALSPGEAFLAWVDLGLRRGKPGSEHWAAVLRAQGAPRWIPLKGTGGDGAWTEDDLLLPESALRDVAHPAAIVDSNANAAIRRLATQRIGPLQEVLRAGDGLPAVTHLIVLPSSLMAGIPVELLVENLTVSYSPSATITAYLRDRPPPKSQGLLAVGDPVFESPHARMAPGSLPEHGLLLLAVSPGSSAAKANPIKLAPNDVLLSYNNIPLHQIDDLDRALAQPLPELVRVKVWQRGGRIRETEIPSGPLGVVINKEPAPQALREQGELEDLTRAPSQPEFVRLDPLPGSRAEVETVASLFAARGWPCTTLMGPDATEQRLDALARGGRLALSRYLLISTHAHVNARLPLRSAVILSRGALPVPFAQLSRGTGVFDGRLTAEEILLGWRLDAELVILSACRSALGKHEIGEGLIGFSQPFLIAGSRSVCLSLWNADDAGTALLMSRFFQNLLGSRAGLAGPMSKMAALAEAKSWLRTLPRAQALVTLGALANGKVRGPGRKLRPSNSDPGEPKPRDREDDNPPFAHPYYWANFILIGNVE